MSRIEQILADHGGIASREQLLAAGIRVGEISLALRTGEVRRIRRSHYALPGAADGSAAAPGAAVAAVRIGGRLGCVSAARSHGIWVNDDAVVHVSLPANAARLRTNRVLMPSEIPLTSDRSLIEVELHWSDVPVSERGHDESAWRVSLETALTQLARCADRIDVIAGFESAVQSRRLDLGAAQRLLDESAPARLGAPRLRGVDGSGAESYLAETLRELGIDFVQQVPFDRVGFVDFLVGGRLVVEVDGFRYHEGREAFRRDRGRDGALLAAGLPTLRIPAALVIGDRFAAAQLVVDALAALAA